MVNGKHDERVVEKPGDALLGNIGNIQFIPPGTGLKGIQNIASRISDGCKGGRMQAAAVAEDINDQPGKEGKQQHQDPWGKHRQQQYRQRIRHHIHPSQRQLIEQQHLQCDEQYKMDTIRYDEFAIH